jgi:hypothetical protein
VRGPYESEEVIGPYEPEEVTGPYESEEVIDPYEPEEVTGPYESEEVMGPYEPEARNKAMAGIKVPSKIKNYIGNDVRFKHLKMVEKQVQNTGRKDKHFPLYN